VEREKEEEKRTHDLRLVNQELLELLVLWTLPDDVLPDVDLPSEAIGVPIPKKTSLVSGRSRRNAEEESN